MKTDNLREVPLITILDLPANRWAVCFPLLEKTATKRDQGKSNNVTLTELADSINTFGLQEAIVLFDGTLLDGRNRREACILAAKTLKQTADEFLVKVEDFVGTEAEAKEFVKTLNLDRRDLDPTMRATSALKWWGEEAKESGERQSLAGQITQAKLRGNDEVLSQLSTTNGTKLGRTSEILAAEFRVSRSYIDTARGVELKRQTAAERAEAHRIAAEKKAQEESEAREAHQKALEAGDELRAKEANLKANEAQAAKIEEREKAAAKDTEASKAAQILEDLHDGKKKMSQVREERKEEGKDEREIAIDKAVQGFNDGYNKVTKNGPFLLKEGRPNDQENVRLKFSHMCEKFGELEEIEGSRQTEHYFSTEKVPSDEHNRWGGEVRMRLAGVDRMIQERGVLPKTVTDDPEFVGVIDRLRVFLDEVETNIHNQEV